MAFTHSLIASTSVGSGGASSMTFNNIPQNYTDLKVVVSTRTTRTTDYADDINVRFNGSSTGYSGKTILAYGGGGVGNSTVSNTEINRTATSTNGATASTFGNFEMYIPNYTSSNHKSVSIDTVGENNAANALSNLTAALWSNVTAITSITLTPAVGPNFVQHSTAYIYGIRAGEY